MDRSPARSPAAETPALRVTHRLVTETVTREEQLLVRSLPSHRPGADPESKGGSVVSVPVCAVRPGAPCWTQRTLWLTQRLCLPSVRLISELPRPPHCEHRAECPPPRVPEQDGTRGTGHGLCPSGSGGAPLSPLPEDSLWLSALRPPEALPSPAYSSPGVARSPLVPSLWVPPGPSARSGLAQQRGH